MLRLLILASSALLLGGASEPKKPQDAFMARLAALCGKAFAGRMTTSDPADRDMAGKPMVMHVAACSKSEVRIPFHVGENRSRTWVVTRTASGLRLKHVHRHEDGSLDPLTNYGGDTAAAGSADRQDFPVDDESIALFRAKRLDRSITNVWAIEATPTHFAYELRREGRHFRVEFDLTRPVPAPPAAWGQQGR